VASGQSFSLSTLHAPRSRIGVKRKEPAGGCCPSSAAKLFSIPEVKASSSSDISLTMDAKLAEEVAKFQKNLFGFSIFVGSCLAYRS
jgi:hypothetical protein